VPRIIVEADLGEPLGASVMLREHVDAEVLDDEECAIALLDRLSGALADAETAERALGTGLSGWVRSPTSR
jgi:hypothetical protein